MSTKICGIQDYVLYCAAGDNCLNLYAAVETAIAKSTEEQISIPGFEDYSLLESYEHLLKHSLIPFVKKHPDFPIYLQASKGIYHLAWNLLPEEMFRIIHTEINLRAIELPCIVLAIDSLEDSAGGEAAVGFLLTSYMDAVIAEFKIMPVSTASSAQAIVFNKKPELGEMMKWHQEFQDQILQNALTYLYPVFGNLGFTRQLMMLAYGLGYLEFNSAHKSEIFLMVEEYIHEKSGILLSRQSCEQSRTIHCRSG